LKRGGRGEYQSKETFPEKQSLIIFLSSPVHMVLQFIQTVRGKKKKKEKEGVREREKKGDQKRELSDQSQGLVTRCRMDQVAPTKEGQQKRECGS